MPKGMSPSERRDYRTTKVMRKKLKESGPAGTKERMKEQVKDTLSASAAQAKIKQLQERIKKMKAMSPGERKARTGSATRTPDFKKGKRSPFTQIGRITGKKKN